MAMLPRLRCLSLLHGGQMVMAQLKQIHAQMITSGLNCSQSASAVGKLVECCCGVSAPAGVDYARLIFRHADALNVFIWNVMIRCTSPGDAILFFAQEIENGDLLPDKFTYIYALGACARSSSPSSALWEGKQIHARIVKTGFASDVYVRTTGIHFYASSKDICSARQLFDEMPLKNSATWNALINGYCSQGIRTNAHPHEALLLFRVMLLDECSIKPTDKTIVSVLSACSQLGDLLIGSCIHGYIQKIIYVPEDDVFIGTTLIDMYSKCGCLSSAASVFKRMKEKNVLTWTALIAGLAIHGQGNMALELFTAMQAENIKPNSVTFTCLLLSCCNTGLIEEGLDIFHSMSSKFNVTPQIQHYGCVVDLLGRVGRLQEAYEFMVQMPLEPDEVLWRSLLNACKIHGDVVMGEKVGKLLLRLWPEQGLIDSVSTCEDYIALSNVYALAQRWEDVEMVRELMKAKGIQTKPGSSSIQSVNLVLGGGAVQNFIQKRH